MAVGSRTPGGLATRIVRLTLTVGIATVLTAGAVAIVSTSTLSAEKADSRTRLGLRQIEDGIESRLREVQSALQRVSEYSATTSLRTDDARRELQSILAETDELFTDAYVAEGGNGLVLASLPTGERRSSVRGLDAFGRVRQGQGGFISVSGTDGVHRELWFTRTAVMTTGRPVVILARVDLEFLDAVTERALESEPTRAVAFMDGESVLQPAGSAHNLALQKARWTPQTESSGKVVVQSVGGLPLEGLYGDVQGLEGLAWRIVIVEPTELAVRDTIRAVAPSIGVLFLGGFIAVLAAWAMSQRLVYPLRELERTARQAAAGSYVRQLPADRDDEIGRVAEAFNALALRLNALHDLSQLLASTSQLDQVLDGVLSAMGHIVGPGAAAIYLLEDSGTTLRPARTRGIDLANARPVERFQGGWLFDALYSEDPRDLQAEPRMLAEAIPGLEGVHGGVLGAPLVVGTEPLGVVVVVRDASRPVSDAEREMVRTFSAQAAVAVNTSRLFKEESESRRTAEALRAVAEELVRPEGLEEALENVETIARSVLGGAFVRVLVVDRSVLGLAPEGGRTYDSEMLGVGLRALGLANGNTVVVVAGEDSAVDSVLDEHDAKALLVVPIALDSEHGAVMLIGLQENDNIREAQLIAQAFADEIALALDNAYFYERAVTRAENLETIFRISQAVGSSLQVKVVLNRVLDVVQKILSADAVALMLYDARKRTLSTAMARGMVPSNVLHLVLEPGADIPGHVFASGEPIAIRDLHTGMGGVAGIAAGNDLGSLLAVPMLARGRSVGVLMVFSSQRGAFSDEELNVLRTFASQAALSIDTARLYSREHDVATVLQQSILPEALPQFPEVTSAAIYAPAGEEVEIGGDYYDLFRAPDGSIWFSIADVCGKGIQAATKTSMIKYAIRALVAAGLPPYRVIGEVNRMTVEAGDPSDIVTAWIGRFDPTSKLLTWSNGGHPPAILKHVGGGCTKLPTTGPLLGALVGVEYEEETISVEYGDEILLYTDGVTEARQGNTFFGEDRVVECFENSEDAGTAAQDLLTAVREFVQAELRDDVAVLVVGISPVANVGQHTSEA